MPEQGTHFWFMSLYGAGNIWRRSGTCTPPRGATRFDMFELLLESVRGEEARLQNATAVAFDIQPNKL